MIRFALAGCALAGCVAFNDVCRPDNSEVVGDTLRSLDVRETTLRTSEAPVGNLLADALLQEVSGADVAIVPAVLFERSTACGPRDFIDRGPIRVGDIASLLPSEENVMLLSITGADLVQILEHSVADLGLAGAQGESPAFLQVAGVLLSVDCALRPQSLSADGKRVLFPGERVIADSVFVAGQPVTPDQPLKLATVASLAQGGYGYVDLGTPGRVLLDTRKRAREILVDHLRKQSPVEPRTLGRIQLRDTCH